MNSLATHLKHHDFLSPEETEQRMRKLERTRWVAFALIAICTLPLVLWFIIFDVFPYYMPALLTVAFGALLWFFSTAVSERQYHQASSRQLEQLRPLLEADDLLRDEVRAWLHLRPLQARDAEFIARLIPAWEQQKITAVFTRSLER